MSAERADERVVARSQMSVVDFTHVSAFFASLRGMASTSSTCEWLRLVIGAARAAANVYGHRQSWQARTTLAKDRR